MTDYLIVLEIILSCLQFSWILFWLFQSGLLGVGVAGWEEQNLVLFLVVTEHPFRLC